MNEIFNIESGPTRVLARHHRDRPPQTVWDIVRGESYGWDSVPPWRDIGAGKGGPTRPRSGQPKVQLMLAHMSHVGFKNRWGWASSLDIVMLTKVSGGPRPSGAYLPSCSYEILSSGGHGEMSTMLVEFTLADLTAISYIG